MHMPEEVKVNIIFKFTDESSYVISGYNNDSASIQLEPVMPDYTACVSPYIPA